MNTLEHTDLIVGQRLRFIWNDGPLAGQVHEHAFERDGTVKWRCVVGEGGDKTHTEQRYDMERVSDDVAVISYLGSSGSTLTAALNFRDRTLVAYVSNATDWHPARGTFEVVEPGERENNNAEAGTGAGAFLNCS